MMWPFLFVSCIFFNHVLQTYCGAEYRPLSVGKSMKVKTDDKPTTLNVNGPSHHCPIPTKHNNQYYIDRNSKDLYYLVNIKKRDKTISAHSLLQVVERNGKFMLILGGTDPYSENTLFKKFIRRYYLPKGTIEMIDLSYYESCKFPGYYIRWHDSSTMVDCEPHADPLSSMFFLWREPERFYDKDVGYSSVVIAAVGTLPLSYLTFEKPNNLPVVQPTVGDATKFDIKFPPPRAK